MARRESLPVYLGRKDGQMSESVICSKCESVIHWLEVFPGNYCLACHAEREESKPMPNAEELAQMFRRVVR